MSVQPTAPTTSMGSYNNIDSLSAEGLLMYCKTQLNHLDTEINAYLNVQKGNIAKKQVLSELKNALNEFQPPKTEAQKEKVCDAYKAAISKLEAMGETGLASDLKEQFYKVFNYIETKTGDWANSATYANKHNSKIPGTKEAWATHVGEVDLILQDITGNAELQMIQLQSMVSARQTAVQLTTNILSKADQTIGAVINNIK